MLRTLTILLALLFCLNAKAQKNCIKPVNAPKTETHLNCTDKKGKRDGLWKYYGPQGYLAVEIMYRKNDTLWLKDYVNKEYYKYKD